MEIEAQPFDLHVCLNESRDLVAHAASEKGLLLVCQIDAGVPSVVIGDAARLRQVLINLLSNAVKFTSGGEVSLRATAEPQDAGRRLVVIAVRDTGIGIASDHQEQIFAPFVQADRSTSRRYGGSGLGLAICRQLVGLMGGEIDLQSAPGQGSVFTVAIPFTVAAIAPMAETRPREQVAPSTLPLRILVAEDNLINQEVTRQLLARLGHDVTVVASGREAINAVARAPYHVVLMDVQMPEMDGQEATEQIRRRENTIHQPYIVALTASALPGDREHFLRSGMDDYLSKPVRPAELQRVLAGVPITSAAPLIAWDLLLQFTESVSQDPSEAGKFVVQLFEHEVGLQVEELEAAVVRADRAQVRREAHRMRGGFLQIGARALAERCRWIEQSDEAADLRKIGDELQTCYAQTLEALRRRYLTQ
jgi:CheY-like chemotaxis protein